MNSDKISRVLRLSHVGIHEEVTSTQDVARALEALPPYLVCALEQTRGKGRLGRTWQSDKGGLYFTLVVRRVRDDWALPLICAYALWQELSLKVSTLSLKWPNDLYVESRKLAGVMVEGWGERLGIGVGLNVNQRDFTGALASTATSLRMLTGAESDPEPLLIGMVLRMLKMIDELTAHGFKHFQPSLRRILLMGDQPVKVVQADRRYRGRLVDLAPSGDALVQTSDGGFITVPGAFVRQDDSTY
jgi:BirA family biotin operon repressor/biotin-[acetyl-CoA-carboxylase] ligase